MEAISSPLPDVLILKPRLFADGRGYSFESHNHRVFAELVGADVAFVQDNQSRSRKGVLRGLHYQNPRAQAKLVRVLAGEIFDVVVDLRRSSPTFARSFTTRLSAENALTLWVPPGFAHGFLARSDTADVLYKASDYYAPEHEHCIAWNDSQLAIEWPLTGMPELSPKDQNGIAFKDAITFA